MAAFSAASWLPQKRRNCSIVICDNIKYGAKVPKRSQHNSTGCIEGLQINQKDGIFYGGQESNKGWFTFQLTVTGQV